MELRSYNSFFTESLKTQRTLDENIRQINEQVELFRNSLIKMAKIPQLKQKISNQQEPSRKAVYEYLYGVLNDGYKGIYGTGKLVFIVSWPKGVKSIRLARVMLLDGQDQPSRIVFGDGILSGSIIGNAVSREEMPSGSVGVEVSLECAPIQQDEVQALWDEIILGTSGLAETARGLLGSFTFTRFLEFLKPVTSLMPVLRPEHGRLLVQYAELPSGELDKRKGIFMEGLGDGRIVLINCFDIGTAEAKYYLMGVMVKWPQKEAEPNVLLSQEEQNAIIEQLSLTKPKPEDCWWDEEDEVIKEGPRSKPGTKSEPGSEVY